MSASRAALPSIREEMHFGRRVRCYIARPRSIGDFYARSVREHAHSDAIVDGDVRLSYAELDEHVQRVAANLRASPLQAGDRIAIVLDNRWQFVVALLASIRAGLIAVPLNVRLAAPELNRILKDCGARVVIAEARIIVSLGQGDDVPAPLTAYVVEQAPEQSRTIDGGRIEIAGFARLLASPVQALAASEVHEEDIAIILYTSGTTGQPKGAMLTHFNVVHSCLHYTNCFELGERERSVLVVPASHVTGVVAIISSMVYTGGAVLLMRRFDAHEFLAVAARECMTHTVMVPAMYNLCLMRADFERHDLGSWRVGAYGGAPMPEATIAALTQKLPHLQLANAYGATETTSPATLMPLGQTGSHGDSVGRAVPCGELRVVDEQGANVPAGHTGEIWIAGPMVVPGYWNDPPGARGAFVDGYWRSGDVGAVDADGYLRVFDRIKDMINRGGYKVYSVEVENVLKFHPAVADVAVVAKPDPVLGEKVRAIVQLTQETAQRREDEGAVADLLRAFCRERLADYKVPEFISFSREALPRNAAGKLLKRELRSRRL
ncbi:MAG: class I adenylate-forming enzyme family protein [Gammaproteobacteria bacterium]